MMLDCVGSSCVSILSPWNLVDLPSSMHYLFILNGVLMLLEQDPCVVD